MNNGPLESSLGDKPKIPSYLPLLYVFGNLFERKGMKHDLEIFMLSLQI